MVTGILTKSKYGLYYTHDTYESTHDTHHESTHDTYESTHDTCYMKAHMTYAVWTRIFWACVMKSSMMYPPSPSVGYEITHDVGTGVFTKP